MSKKSLLFIVASIAIGIFLLVPYPNVLAASNEDDQAIIQTVNSFYDCIEKGDKSSYLNLMTSAVAERLKINPSQTDPISAVYFIIDKVKAGELALSFRHRKITLKERKGDTVQAEATLIVKIDYLKDKKAEEEKTTDKFTLKYQGKKWLIEKFGSED